MSLDNLMCHRCGKETDKERWHSEWDPNYPEEHHYKSFLCDCGKKNWVRVDFSGSGHDRVIQEKNNSIESTVKNVQEG